MVLDDFIKTIPSKPGVYQFYVYPLGKYYIGESVDIRRRIKEHLTKGGNVDIACMIEMYGLDCIGFQVLCFEEDKQYRLKLEDKYKKLYGFDRLLNKVEGLEKTTNITKKSISCFNLVGDKIADFESAVKASEFFKCHNSTISAAVTGKTLSAVGLIWMLNKGISQKLVLAKIESYKLAITNLRNKQTDNLKIYGKDARKKVLCKNLKTKETLTFSSIKEASEKLNIPYSTISHNLLKTHRSRNFEWSYVND